MLLILKKIFVTLVIIIVIDKIFTYGFMHFIFFKTISGQSGGTINYVISNKNDFDFLILGSSRAKDSFDPSILSALGKHGYNLGINGTTALNNLLTLDILIRNGVRPKVLVLQTDLFDYSGDTEDKTVEQLKRVYPYDTPLIHEYVARVGFVERAKYFFGLYRLNRKILNITYNFIKKDSAGSSNGYVGLDSADKMEEAGFVNYTYDKTSLNSEAIKRIKKLCDENYIRLIVVFPPSYKNIELNNVEQARLVADLKSDSITDIIDMSNINAYTQLTKEEDWRDSYHFTSHGSQEFSHLFNDELLKKKLFTRPLAKSEN